MAQHGILFIVRHRTTEKRLLPGLQRHYAVEVVQTRRDAIAHLHSTTSGFSVDLVLVDLPSLRFDLTRFYDDVQALDASLPFFLLLSKGMRLDQLPHANGHLRHPCTQRQLLRRLARVLPEHQGEVVAWRGIQLDTERHILMWDDKQAPLTTKQAGLALAFLETPDELITRVQLMQDVWGTDYMGDTRTLDVHIHWLRKSLKALQAPFALETKRGQGYKLICNLPDPQDKAQEHADSAT